MYSLYISDGPHYLSSLSYLADSSLSEEMSQFDFSTGVQSYSYSSQDPKSTHGHFRRRVITFHILKNIIGICKGREVSLLVEASSLWVVLRG